MDRHYEKLESTVPGASNAIDSIRPVKYGYKARVTLPHECHLPPGASRIPNRDCSSWAHHMETLAKVVDLTRKELQLAVRNGAMW